MIIALILLSIAAGALILRAVMGPTVADRAVALDAFVSVLSAGILVGAAQREEPLWLATAVILALVAFIGTAIVARYIAQRGL